MAQSLSHRAGSVFNIHQTKVSNYSDSGVGNAQPACKHGSLRRLTDRDEGRPDASPNEEYGHRFEPTLARARSRRTQIPQGRHARRYWCHSQCGNDPGTLPASNETIFTGSDPIPSKSKSGFAHSVYHLTDQLNLIAGVRYTKEDKTYKFQRTNPYGAGPSYNPVGALDGSSKTYSGSHVDYRAGVEYQWTQSVMTYAQWSTGFRGGGVNPRPFIVQQETTFRPETNTNQPYTPVRHLPTSPRASPEPRVSGL